MKKGLRIKLCQKITMKAHDERKRKRSRCD